ncbi:MAG TPA: YncE family protein [Dehalococcoidia bacterium]|nr:YncE family protein [Dehalococcoidia bacterium]
MKLPRPSRYTLPGAALLALVVGLPLVLGSPTPLASALGVVRTLPTDQAPIGLDVDPVVNRVYTANVLGNGEAGSYSIVDANTGAITNVGVPNPQDVVVNPNTGKAYISTGDNHVLVVTRDNPTNIAKRIGVGTTPKWMAVNPQRNLIYVALHNGDGVHVIDGNTDSATGFINLSDRDPVEPAVDIAANRLYVTAFNSSGRVAVVDTNTNNKIGDLGVRGDQFEIDVDQNTGRVFVASNDGAGGWVSAYDRNGNRIHERRLCTRVTGLVYNPNSDHVFVSCEYSEPPDERSRTTNVLRSDLADVTIIRHSDMIPGPAMAVDETRNLVYVGNTYSKVTNAGRIMTVIQDDGSSPPPTCPGSAATDASTPVVSATAPRVLMPLISKGASGC